MGRCPTCRKIIWPWSFAPFGAHPKCVEFVLKAAAAPGGLLDAVFDRLEGGK